jgi:hypothetical protein
LHPPIYPTSGPPYWLFQGPPAKANSYQQISYHNQGRTLKHILVSVWHASYTYGSRSFQVFINCYTGKMAGEHPLSWVKTTLAVLGLRNS